MTAMKQTSGRGRINYTSFLYFCTAVGCSWPKHKPVIQTSTPQMSECWSSPLHGSSFIRKMTGTKLKTTPSSDCLCFTKYLFLPSNLLIWIDQYTSMMLFVEVSPIVNLTHHIVSHSCSEDVLLASGTICSTVEKSFFVINWLSKFGLAHDLITCFTTQGYHVLTLSYSLKVIKLNLSKKPN